MKRLFLAGEASAAEKIRIVMVYAQFFPLKKGALACFLLMAFSVSAQWEAEHLNDGGYWPRNAGGYDSSSWIGPARRCFAMVALAEASTVECVAVTWPFTGRKTGRYILEYTPEPNPTPALSPDAWQTIGAFAVMDNTVFSGEGGAALSYRRAMANFTPITGVTAIRVVIDHMDTSTEPALSEIEIYASGGGSADPLTLAEHWSTPDTGVMAGRSNLALTGTPIQQDNYGNAADWGAAHAFDGIYGVTAGDAWIAGAAESYLGVRLDGVYDIDHIAISSASDETDYNRSAGEYTLEYTTDTTLNAGNPEAVAWNSIGVWNNPLPKMTRKVFRFDTLRYVTGMRVRVAKADYSEYISVDELEVYGDLPALPPEDDADSDGLTNVEEYGLGTDPENPDSDGDGMPDGWEAANGLDPLADDAAGDLDGDGLTNLEEYTLGTNPALEDTDSDGMPDAWEVYFGLDPLADDAVGDLDSDGLTNVEEYGLGTDPENPDSDGDGMPDGWEAANGLDPLVDDASGDLDSDGLTNLEEYTLGTNPALEDTDSDGMPDAWEVYFGLDPLRNDAEEDADGDGRSNIDEYIYDTSPIEVNEVPVWRGAGMLLLIFWLLLAGAWRLRAAGRIPLMVMLAAALLFGGTPARAFEIIELESMAGLGKTYLQTNLAREGTAFAENTLSGWDAAKAVDGSYDRNNSSWIANAAGSSVGVALAEAAAVDRVAFSGPFSNRAEGSYTVQVTTVSAPDAATPDAAWQTMGTVEVALPYATRRLVQFAAVENVTGVRLALSTTGNPIAISELEVYAEEPAPVPPSLTVTFDTAPGSGASHGLTNIAPLGTAYDGISVPDNNPGNIFLTTEEVVLLPDAQMQAQGAQWELRDVDDALTDAGSAIGESLNMGLLAPGWYCFSVFDGGASVVGSQTLAVLEPLPAGHPDDSPVCLDTAVSWTYRGDAAGQATLLELARLTGVSYIRDRYTWGDLMPDAGTVRSSTTYDSAATSAEQRGLEVLSVFHSTPDWARDATLDPDNPGRRFPRNLLDLHDFCQTLAERYTGRITAWEPWNEANIVSFGGHLIDEMASLQKAAWWGFQTGGSGVHVCWNNYSGPGTDLHAAGVSRNKAWPYFDSYNVHMYSAPEKYEAAFTPALEGAAGRPLWLTESGVQVTAATPDPEGDLDDAGEIEQARFIPVSIATALWAGVDRYFFFMLPAYYERGFQYGLLRYGTLTPRRGYVAMANTGRRLAGASCLGRVVDSGAGTHIYAFDAEPGGVQQNVFIVWADSSAPWPLPPAITVSSVYDLYGRDMGSAPATIGADPVFVVAPAGSHSALTLEAPVSPAPWQNADACPVVMQVRMPQQSALIQKQAYRVNVAEQADIPARVYNFSDTQAAGTLSVTEAPAGWTAQVAVADQSFSLAAMDSRDITFHATLPASGDDTLYGGWITLTGNFGAAGEAVLSFRLAGDPGAITPVSSTLIPDGNTPARWAVNITAGGAMTRSSLNGGVLFEMTFPSDADPWAYPRFTLNTSEKPAADDDGLALDVQLIPGSADATIRVQFVESSGAVYRCETSVPRTSRIQHHIAVLFEEAVWAANSAVDPDGVLTPADITRVLAGINGTADSATDLWIRDPAWVRY
jgi:hypothetical protein